MMAMLPMVEKEYKNAEGIPSCIAILYDSLQIIWAMNSAMDADGLDSEGNPMVLPLEDAAKVEQFRRKSAFLRWRNI